MKLSASGLKNINFKQVLIDHGEKFVVVLIAMFIGYSLYQTSWATYAKAPEELAAKAETAETELKSGQWPEADKKAIQPKFDLAAAINRLQSPLNSGKYGFSTDMLWSLYRRKEPIQEPVWLPVDDMVADYGQVLIPLLPEKGAAETVADAASGPGDKKKPEAKKPGEEDAVDALDVPEEFRKRGNGMARAPRGRQGNKKINITLNRGASERAADRAADEARRAAAAEQAPRRGRRGDKRGDDQPLGSALTSTERGRGHRFVSVRGVFPLHRQAKELVKAMHLDNQASVDIERLIQFQSFELERQIMVNGAADPWSGPWEPVDLKVADSVMREVAGYEEGNVSDAVISNIFTMPLPYREVGEWGSLVSHPNLTDFELDDEEVNRQFKMKEKLYEELKKQKSKEEKKVAPGGFAALGQPDIREQITSNPELMKNLSDDEFLKKLVSESDPNVTSEEEKKKIVERIKGRISAAGNLLLFRYLDFEVQPGNTYRYRVRLVLYNPFVNRKPEEVLTPEVAEGQFRTTQWSEPTPPIAVPGDADYFVNKVDSGRRGTLPSAEIDLFQWSTDTGTIVNAPVRTNVGQSLGGQARNVPVLRPIKGTFEKENFKFSTDDVLLDVVAKPAFDRSLHPDVQLPPNAKGPIGVSDQALVMNKYGNFLPLDQSSLQESHESAKKKLELQNAMFEDIRDKFAKEKQDLEDNKLGGKRGDDDKDSKDDDRKTGSGKGNNRSNPRRNKN